MDSWASYLALKELPDLGSEVSIKAKSVGRFEMDALERTFTLREFFHFSASPFWPIE